MEDQIRQLAAALGEAEWVIGQLRQRCALLNVEVQNRDAQIAALTTDSTPEAKDQP